MPQFLKWFLYFLAGLIVLAAFMAVWLDILAWRKEQNKKEQVSVESDLLRRLNFK